jgi:hypothetical protein
MRQQLAEAFLYRLEAGFRALSQPCRLNMQDFWKKKSMNITNPYTKAWAFSLKIKQVLWSALLSLT